MAGAGVGLKARASTPSRSRIELARFAAEVMSAADRRPSTDRAPVHTFAVGAAPFAVHFATPRLHELLTPAWSALPSSSSAADGTTRIDVVASDVAGPPPRPPWSPTAYRPRDEIDGYGDARLEVGFQLTTGTLMLWDAEAQRGVWWTRATDRIPSWERAMPLRTVVRWALRDRGLALGHGAVIGRRGRFALLAGPGGAGKSTLALAAQQAGWEYVGDDYCAVDPERGLAYPLTRYAKATAATRALVPTLDELASDVPSTPEGKTVLAIPQVSASGAPLALMALPRVVSSEGGVPTRLPQALAMSALAPTTLLQMPGSRERDRQLLGRIVRSLPAWSLPSGPSTTSTLDHLDRLLDAGHPA